MSTQNMDHTTTAASNVRQQIYRHSQIQLMTPHRTPSLHLLDNTMEAKKKYLSLCVPLHKAALRGDWKTAREILHLDMDMINSSITKGGEMILHVAVGANHVHFVEELVKMMKVDDLGLQDQNGNTAFAFAAVVGNIEIAEIMRRNNPYLPTIRGGGKMMPLYMAALQGKSKMAWYLYHRTVEALEENDWNVIFFACIKTGLYDLAVTLLEGYEALALARDENGETGLHVLAQNAAAFDKKDSRYHHVLELIKRLWDHILTNLNYSDIMTTINQPSHLLFSAAEAGNAVFLSELISAYPDLIWEIDSKNRTIIHIAVLHRHANIFNLLREFGAIKEFIVRFTDDDEGNNMLHVAAKLAPSTQLNQLSGAALQMQLELSWFEEVRKIMLPIDIEMRNKKGETPRQLFTIEHERLLRDAERWMKDTSNSCMIVSTLIATGVFAAAFSIPGGNDNNGSPNCIHRQTFTTFAVADATSLVSSSSSILMFLSILISRYAEDDFYRSLPLKLMIGLLALFVSITSMMVAFSCAFYMSYYHAQQWVPTFISVLAFLPVLLFVFLQYPLWCDIVYSAYHCRYLFRPSFRMIT